MSYITELTSEIKNLTLLVQCIDGNDHLVKVINNRVLKIEELLSEVNKNIKTPCYAQNCKCTETLKCSKCSNLTCLNKFPYGVPHGISCSNCKRIVCQQHIGFGTFCIDCRSTIPGYRDSDCY